MDTDLILNDLKIFTVNKMNISNSNISVDAHFLNLQIDSMSRLEILLHADDTFGSFVLDYLEEGLLIDKEPNTLRELAELIPLCMTAVNQLAVKTKSI